MVRGQFVRKALVVFGLGIAALGMVAGPAVSSGPVTIYDNLVDGGYKSANGVFLAQSFTTDDTGGDLSSLKIMYRGSNEANSFGAASSFTASIYSSSAGQPATLVSAIETKSTGAWENETYTLSVPAGISLAPNTEYFVVVNGAASGTVVWKFTPTPPATFEGSGVSAWTSANGTSWSSLSGTYFSLQVQTTPVAVAPILGELSDVEISVGDDPISITPPTSNAAGTWDYETSDPAIFTIENSSLIPVGVGSATLTANFTPTDSAAYLAGSVTATVTVAEVIPTPTPTPTATEKPTKSPTPTESQSAVPTPSSTQTPTASPTVSPTPTATPSPTAGVDTDIETDTPTPVELPRLQDNFFAEPEPLLSAELNAEAGMSVSEGKVLIAANGLAPNSQVIAVAYSDPIEFFRGSVDANGQLDTSAFLPSGLDPSATHSVVITGTTADGKEVTIAGAISLDANSVITAAADMAEVAAFTNATETSLIRAAKYNLALYDPSVNVVTTTGVVIAATSLLALGGTGGLTQTPNQNGERRNSQGKLANVVTKKLKAAGNDDAGFGDLKLPKRPAGSVKIDQTLSGLVLKFGTKSALIPRILVDGSWFRVLFGSGSLLLWFGAALIAALDALANPDAIAMPSLSVLFVIVVLSFIDSLAGAFAFVTVALISVLQGEIAIAADFRLLLGLGVLMTSLPLLVHVIRPLRRKVVDRESAIERFFDYLMPPVFVAFAAGGMLKALNGLSGLELVTPEQIEFIRWAGFFGVLIRMAGEDLALRLFPQRCLTVHPQKLPSQSRPAAAFAIVARTAIFLFIAEPFFGIGPVSVTAAFLLALPLVLKLWEDDLPNLNPIHKWLPRGLFRFALLLVTSILLSRLLLGEEPTDELLKSNFAWLLVPAFVAAVLELFGRFGGDWENTRIKWLTGAPIWIFAVGLTLGLIQI